MPDKSIIKKEAQRHRYRGRVYYLCNGVIYTQRMEVLIPDATNGFLDLYEYFEYFPQNKLSRGNKVNGNRSAAESRQEIQGEG